MEKTLQNIIIAAQTITGNAQNHLVAAAIINECTAALARIKEENNADNYAD